MQPFFHSFVTLINSSYILMKEENINLDMFQEIPSELTLISYTGKFNIRTLDTLISNIRTMLVELNIEKRTSKNIYSISVECLENIMKHGKSQAYAHNNREVYGRFAFGRVDNCISFVVSNEVSDNDMERLSKKLSDLDEMELEQIKEKYKYDLINGQISDRGGAGLGMYVMALKSNKNYRYQFIPPGNEKTDPFFTLLVNIECDFIAVA